MPAVRRSASQTARGARRRLTAVALPELGRQLARDIAERLAPSKRPRRFVFHAELPRTSVGKIRKFELR